MTTSLLGYIVDKLVAGAIILAFVGPLIWALVNLRKPDPKLQQQYDFAKIREPRIIEMQPKRRIIEAPLYTQNESGKSIAAISGIL